MQVHVASASFVAEKPSEPLLQRIWPPAFLAGATGLTAIWTVFIGYALVSLVIL